MESNSYDPTWLIEAAKLNLPNELWLQKALAKCTHAFSTSSMIIHFVNPAHANKPGSDWQFRTNITLENTTEGFVVLDILEEALQGEGLRVGAVEFIDRL